MKTTEVNETLIGRKVQGICNGFQVTGTIIAIIDEPYYKGVKIELEKPLICGGEIWNCYSSTARKSDEFGNLISTKLIEL